VVFALRCYVESETTADDAAYRLRPLKVHVLVTGGYLLTLHEEPVSLPTALTPGRGVHRVGSAVSASSAPGATVAIVVRRRARSCPDSSPVKMSAAVCA
jgi:hypothetical protein